MQHRVVVVGSANVDYSVRVDAFPHAGETRLGDSLHRRPGGKGLNQAIAAARFGAEVSFVGSVGADADGELLARTLHEEGIDASHLTVDRQARTGFASIYVAPDGQNSIVVAPGANSLVAPPTAAAAIRACARRGDVVVVQAEVPIAVLADVVDTAAELHLRTVINLAPYSPLSSHTLQHAHPLVVNEVEATELVGWPVDGIGSGLRAAEQLARTVARSAVVTLGAAGASWAEAGEAHHEPGRAVPAVVDTTGAGDALVGALAALLAEGAGLGEATRIAAEAAAISVTREGAQASYARRAEVTARL